MASDVADDYARGLVAAAAATSASERCTAGVWGNLITGRVGTEVVLVGHSCEGHVSSPKSALPLSIK